MLKAPLSRYELRIFFAKADDDDSGEVSADEFQSLIYRVQLERWPDLEEEAITEAVDVLNAGRGVLPPRKDSATRAEDARAITCVLKSADAPNTGRLQEVAPRVGQLVQDLPGF